ncbi:PspC domain-containing protein [Streptomyces gobiensis]|uniref:PspC domain-containing protein n=1 Tax=Streptomyces gobiensis TaxID=2875706 RepID=UPI001E391EB6|nr:PspC domain-containing protein [Streptomyces gobiensis]UGY93184.1 PspC domain-containing protein [Streptomyces gobiensis]
MTEDQRVDAADADGAAADTAADTAASGPAEAPARLERSRQHKVIGGVCGGLGRHFDVDPVIFRVPLAILAVIGGLGLVAYGFAWLLIPLEGEEENEGRRLLSGRVEASSLAALLCALAGSGLVLASLGSGRSMTFSLLVLVAVGAAVHWSRQRRKAAAEEEITEPLPDAPPEAQAPPVPATPSWWQEPLTKHTGHPDTGYLWGPDDGPYGGPYDPEPCSGPAVPHEWATIEVQEREQGRSIGGLVFLGALSAAVIGTAAAWPTQPLGIALVIGLSCALAVFGLGLVISAFAGRTGGGTITAVVLTAVLLAGAAALPRNITTSWADTTWSPAAVADVRSSYELGSGRGVLDLSGLEVGDDQTVRTAMNVGAGELRVIVPENVTVQVDLKIGLGGYRLPGEVNGGGAGLADTYSVAPRGGGDPQGTVKLKLEVGMGEAVVEQRGTAR